MSLEEYLATTEETRGAVIVRSPEGGVIFGPVWKDEAPLEELRPLMSLSVTAAADGLIFIHASEEEFQGLSAIYR